MPRSRAKKEFHSIHLNGTIYPEALAAVRQVTVAEDRTAANAAALLICEAWAARQARQNPDKKPPAL